MTNPKRIILFINKTFPPFPPFPLVTYHCLESKIIPDLLSRQWVFWRESRFLALPRAVLPAVTGLPLLVGEHVGLAVLAAAAISSPTEGPKLPGWRGLCGPYPAASSSLQCTPGIGQIQQEVSPKASSSKCFWCNLCPNLCIYELQPELSSLNVCPCAHIQRG